MKYKQPAFYKFNEDSIELVNSAILNLKGKKIKKLLDIGAGCGIVALDFLEKYQAVEEVFFLEVQKEFQESLETNIIERLPKKITTKIFYSKLSHFYPETKFDLILCNPPYFSAQEGRQSPNKNKQICRSFKIDSAEIFLTKMLSLLTDGGKAFLLVPNNVKIWNIALENLKDFCVVQELDHVSIVLISKINLNK